MNGAVPAAILSFILGLMVAMLVMWNTAIAEAPVCMDGIVLDRLISDRVLYPTGYFSSWPTDEAHYYLIIIHQDGTRSYREVREQTAYLAVPGTYATCVENSSILFQEVYPDA